GYANGYGEEYPMGYIAEEPYGQYEPMGYYGQYEPMGYYGQYEPMGYYGQYEPMGYYGQTPEMPGYARSEERRGGKRGRSGERAGVWGVFFRAGVDEVVGGKGPGGLYRGKAKGAGGGRGVSCGRWERMGYYGQYEPMGYYGQYEPMGYYGQTPEMPGYA